MIKIFEQGAFTQYRTRDLNESMKEVSSYLKFSVTSFVFLSHKHDDLEDLKDTIGFLENEYNVKVYIDSRDPSMPITTSSKTADNIKERIKQCDKFILLATEGAIESKWCNWELGFGDAHKYIKNIALFPFKPKGKSDTQYKGNEYMSIYPYITYYNGSERYNDGDPITKGYYVRTEKEGSSTITPLSDWLKR